MWLRMRVILAIAYIYLVQADKLVRYSRSNRWTTLRSMWAQVVVPEISWASSVALLRLGIFIWRFASYREREQKIRTSQLRKVINGKPYHVASEGVSKQTMFNYPNHLIQPFLPRPFLYQTPVCWVFLKQYNWLFSWIWFPKKSCSCNLIKCPCSNESLLVLVSHVFLVMPSC